MENKLIFEFSKNKTDGDSSLNNLLGGKGANLAEMSNMGIPVPPGFTITTEVCNYFTENKKLPDNKDMLSRTVFITDVMNVALYFA